METTAASSWGNIWLLHHTMTLQHLHPMEYLTLLQPKPHTWDRDKPRSDAQLGTGGRCLQ